MGPKVGGGRSSGSAWAPMRKDAPGRLVRTRGTVPELNSAAAREAAVKAVEADVYAASSTAGVISRRNMHKKALGKWGQVPIPALGREDREGGGGTEGWQL